MTKLVLDNGKSLELIKGDITKVPADAIANAANSGLWGGGGVDGAIHDAGGPSIMAELDVIRARIGRCPTGSAVATSAGHLPAKWVFHAVGPVWEGGDQGEPELLASAYNACLQLAAEHRAARLSFPSISTGVYGYPLDQAAAIAVRTALAHLASDAENPQEIVFVLFSPAILAVFEQALEAAPS